VGVLVAVPRTKMILTAPGQWAKRLASIARVRILRGPVSCKDSATRWDGTLEQAPIPLTNGSGINWKRS
jgi:hypothetical protein